MKAQQFHVYYAMDYLIYKNKIIITVNQIVAF